MNENKAWKILQIIPAQVRWKAVHCQEAEGNQVTIFNRAVVCWALVEAVGADAAARTEVRGIEQDSNRLVVVEDRILSKEIGEDGIDPNQYFLGYDDPEAHKESAYWIQEANERFKTQKQKRSKKQ